MTYVFGLGNPDTRYQFTRHNAGWLFLDFLSKQYLLGEFRAHKKLYSLVLKHKDLILAKPTTYMNESGTAVQAVIQFFSSHDLSHKNSSDAVVIAFDDLDIPFGQYKIQPNSGPKIHNGLNSIRDQIKEFNFLSVRIGVDARDGDRTLPGNQYVLSRFSKGELLSLEQVFQDILTVLEKKQLFHL